MAHRNRRTATYIGTLDDMALKYPWNFQMGEDFLNREIFRSVVLGREILINDGYLINHPLALSQVMEGDNSPLRALAREGHVRILCRDKENENFHLMPEKMATNGISTYQKLIRQSNWPETRRRLESFGNSIRSRGGIEYWPSTDMSISFERLIDRLDGLSTGQIGLTSVSDVLFRKVLEHFRRSMREHKDRPRDRWEKVCRSMVTLYDCTDRELAVRQLMNLANEVYHYNFGLALSANSDREISVETQYSYAFADFLRSETGIASLQGQIPSVRLPNNIPYNDGSRLPPFCDPSSKIGEARSNYLDAMNRYLNGRLDREQATDAADCYQARIHEYFKHSRDLNSATIPARITLAIVGGVVSLVADPIVGSVFGVLAFVGGEYGVPRLVKKFRIDEGASSVVSRAQGWFGPLGGPAGAGHAISSVALDREKAITFLDGVPRFD